MTGFTGTAKVLAMRVNGRVTRRAIELFPRLRHQGRVIHRDRAHRDAAVLDVTVRTGRDGSVKPRRLSAQEHRFVGVTGNAGCADNPLAWGMAGGAVACERRVRSRELARTGKDEGGGALRGGRTRPRKAGDGNERKEPHAQVCGPTPRYHHRRPK